MILPLLAARVFSVAPDGDDGADGRTRPWRTLGRASREAYVPGDRLVLRGRLAGTLRLTETKGLSVVGKGATLDGGAGDGLVVEGGKDLRIEGLRIVGSGRKANDGAGVLIHAADGTRLVDLDVSGFRVAGVRVDGGAGTRLERIVAHDNGSAGIEVVGGYGTRRSRDVTIYSCRAIDNPGDPKNLTNHSGNGIVVGGVDGCLIELCEAAGNGWDMPRTGNGPVGIWAWNASRVTIRRNVSHDNRSPGTDGGGFDLDGGVTDSVMEDNLSYGNAGTGYLLCQYAGGGEWRDNVVRNNVSYEDGEKNFHSGVGLFVPDGMANMRNVLLERNTIVNLRYAVATQGDVPGAVYRRNVLLGREAVRNVAWGPGGFTASRFEANLEWPTDPRLRLPTSAKDLPTDPLRVATMPWFRPLPGSPCVVDGKIFYGARL